MGYYDELDDEIDQEMGWKKKGAKGKGDKGGGKGDKSARRRPDYWLAILKTARVSSPVWRLVGRILRGVAAVVFFPVISPLGYAKRFNAVGDMMVVKRSLWWRIADGLLTRALLAPVFLGIFCIGLVYATTHPQAVQAMNTPETYGVYFKRVSIITGDNQRLTGWYIPPVTAAQMTFDPEGTLSQKWPAVVLTHGLGQGNDHYLSLAQELHAFGFVVLMLDMRGEGESDPAAVTYGLRERLDVLAAVKYLQDTPYIDEGKIVLVGHDIGATASLQAAALDSAIAGVVADGLWPKFEDRARQIFSQAGPGEGGSLAQTMCRWLAPLYSLTFEVAVRDRLSQLDLDAVLRELHRKPVLFLAEPGPQYAAVGDVFSYANASAGHHEAIVPAGEDDPEARHRIRDFAVKATNWRGPNAHGMDQIQSLLKNQVKHDDQE